MDSEAAVRYLRVPWAVARRELRLVLAGRRWLILAGLVAGYGVALSVATLILWDRWFTMPAHGEKIARRIILLICLVETCAAVCLGPLLGAPAISRERGRRALDLLLAGGAGGLSLVVGKFGALTLVAVPFLLVPLPVLGGLLTRGVPFPPSFLLSTRLTLLVLFAGLLALGLACSAVARRSRMALAASASLTVVLVAAPVLAGPLIRGMPRPEGFISALLTLNPFAVVAPLVQFDIMRSGPIYAATPVGETAFSYPQPWPTLLRWLAATGMLLVLSGALVSRRGSAIRRPWWSRVVRR